MPNQFEMDAASGGNSGRIVLLSDLLIDLGISNPSQQETQIARNSLLRSEGAVMSHLGYNPAISLRTEYYPQNNYAGHRQGVWEANETSAYFRETSGSLSSELQLMGLPLRASNSTGGQAIEVRIDYDGRNGTREGSFGVETIKVEGTDFFPNYTSLDSAGVSVCFDGIIRSFGLWPALAGSVKVTYLAGYTANELIGADSLIDASPIRESVVDEATRRFHKTYSRMKKRIGVVGPMVSESLGDYSYQLDQGTNAKLIGTEATLLKETVLKLEPFVNFGIKIGA